MLFLQLSQLHHLCYYLYVWFIWFDYYSYLWVVLILPPLDRSEVKDFHKTSWNVNGRAGVWSKVLGSQILGTCRCNLSLWVVLGGPFSGLYYPSFVSFDDTVIHSTWIVYVELCHMTFSYFRTKSLRIGWIVLGLISLTEGEVLTLTLEPYHKTALSGRRGDST